MFRYQLLAPESIESAASYPLVVFLHGAGERGGDGERHLTWFPQVMAEPRNRKRYPCYVLALQCRIERQWVDVRWDDEGSTPMPSEPSMDLQRVIAAVEELFTFAAIDRRRVYLTGLSMGGYGAWDLAMRRPHWFAALLPICGGGDQKRVGRITAVPTWVFHGADDDVVPVSRSREMVAALREAGAAPQYSEIEGRGHDSWLDAYGPKGALDWMFAQALPEASGLALIPRIPTPRAKPDAGGEGLDLPRRMVLSQRIVCNEDLWGFAGLLAAEFEAVTGLGFVPEVSNPQAGDIALRLEAGLEYSFRVETAECCVITAIDVPGLSAGTAKLLQLVSLDHGVLRLPELRFEDHPDLAYRCVSVDCARFPQSIDSLKQVVDLCRFYSVGLLQLHLTDDAAFTFPVDALPGLATEGRCYSKAELRELDAYARERGVGIVPEFDVPGHSAALVAYDPQRFGLADTGVNPALAHLTRPAVLTAVTSVIGEMCEVFQSSPFFHFGGDEAWLMGVDEDPDCQSYAAEYGYKSAHDLFRVFLNEVYAIVKAAGREPIVWEGFRREGSDVALPKDLAVVAWDTQYYRPDLLAADGYPVINASWRPLYVVGGGRLPLYSAPRRWPVEEIYAWNPNRFDHFDPTGPSFGGLHVPTVYSRSHSSLHSSAHTESGGVRGAQICVWEQKQQSVIDSLVRRLAAFSEKSWHAGEFEFAEFSARLIQVERRCLALVRPVTILPRPAGCAVCVPLEARDRIRIESVRRGVVRYTTDGTEPLASSAVYTEAIAFADRRVLVVRARLFAASGEALGGCDSVTFVASRPVPVEYSLYRLPEDHLAGETCELLKGSRRRDAYEIGELEVVRGGPVAGVLRMVLRGRIRITEGGKQDFGVRCLDGAMRLTIDRRVVCERSVSSKGRLSEGQIELAVGDYDIQIDYLQGPMGALCRVCHRAPSQSHWRLVDRLMQNQ